ncbi:protein transport protein SEC61 subunit alpha [Strigomonas culicis]|uniref:Protein transport protein SEC61 subunit alpha n=1 Tax=Strigomonas culicis TaxID=28005 RepID=S9VY73_9TRYP|nr:protein transport protein SEC61 subunit alpha [Strigomonas culicis]EPY32036.1 protein transport protein SEC61 subunit alpha [Strigomonas culicis]|eukprot:EPY19573.1 protein transport protein SEC61 subunit alpha [Strigomonas culicis]
MSSGLLYILKPILQLLPEIDKPARLPPIKERIMWTAVALFIFLVSCQVPVYGARPANSSDPFYWMRIVLASNRGTLMELGISPMVTASLILELIAGVGIITYDAENKEERSLFEALQKLLAIFITVCEASAYVSSGMYGEPSRIGFFMCAVIVLQLLFSTIVCMLLDELLQRGWGIGSGTSLFIATNVCETIVWKCFSPSTINTGRGAEFEGAIIAFFHLLVSRSDKVRALREAFYRPQLPNLTNVFATLVVFVIVVFFQGFRVPLITKSKFNSMDRQPYLIKLFYTSNMPIILQTSIVSNINFVSQVLSRRFGNRNFLINLLGRWEERGYHARGNSQQFPVGGLAYYLTAPSTFYDLLADPIHAIFYIVFVLASCALFSRLWITISHTAPRDVAKQLAKQGRWLIQARESEEDMARLLDKYIPVAASFGGLCVGALTLFADFLGAIGSGTGILLSVTMINQYFEILRQEGQELGYNFLNKKMN